MSRKTQPVETEELHDYGRDGARRETHPAFAVAIVTRSSGTGRTLFQSDLRHRESITLRIETADRTRDLSHDWVHPQKMLVEVEMSLAQWGALVSSIGIGSGVPVTLRAREADYQIPDIPYEPRIAENVSETRGAVSKLLARARETLVQLEDAITNKKGAKAVASALSLHESVIRNAEANAGFAIQSLAEAAEVVTSSAKADIEAHILNAARLTGTDAASIEAPSFSREELEQ